VGPEIATKPQANNLNASARETRHLGMSGHRADGWVTAELTAKEEGVGVSDDYAPVHDCTGPQVGGRI
jgi:hypothetical protein